MNIVVAATGGAAAVKTPFVLRRLREAGHEVRAAASEDAYHFVTRQSLALASGSEVLDRERWFRADGQALHLEWASWADLLLVAPATANALAAAAHGHAHDAVSSLVVAGVDEVAWAPAMNAQMWTSAAVQRNVERLRGDGHVILGPGEGAMAAVGESHGSGRMLEPEELLARVEALLGRRDLLDHQLLISAGPTREYIDPVRYLSNPSSGRMGYELARAAAARGARVTLVSGPTELTAPDGITLVPVVSAKEMYAAIREAFPSCDALVMTAAVADWKPATTAPQKVPKLGERQTLELVRTDDILESLVAEKRHQVVAGFAMETEAGVERAAGKARRKALDFICLNYPTREGSGFGGPDNEVTIVTPDGNAQQLPRMPKTELAHLLLDRISELLPGAKTREY